MFRVQKKKSGLTAAIEVCEVIYHCTARSARGNYSNAFFGLVMNVLMTALFIVAFYATMWMMGMTSAAIRGDFVLFLMSGVMSYMTYNKTMKAVYSSEGPTSPMMQHAPMTTFVAITSTALATLYNQILAIFVILFIYHVVFKPVEINAPAFAFSMLLVAWLFGVATGLVLLAIRPWAPKFAPVLMMVISRINIFASGKMMVGNMLSFTLLKMFSWNPLFHIIDQMRGAIFVNYYPRNSTVGYVLVVTGAMIVIGMMGEFFTRKHASSSWYAR